MTEPKGTVLVVDDDPVNRMMLTHSLTQEGYQTTAAEDGEQALEMLERERFDLVLLDVVMPGVDGFTVLEYIKRHNDLRHLPAIMISGLDDMEGAVRCIEMGAEDFLPKPFDPVVLRARMNAGLAKKRLHDVEQEHQATLQAHAAHLEELNRELLALVAELQEEGAPKTRVAELERLRKRLLSEWSF